MTAGRLPAGVQIIFSSLKALSRAEIIATINEAAQKQSKMVSQNFKLFIRQFLVGYIEKEIKRVGSARFY